MRSSRATVVADCQHQIVPWWEHMSRVVGLTHFQTVTFSNVSRLQGVECCLLSKTTSPTVEDGRSGTPIASSMAQPQGESTSEPSN